MVRARRCDPWEGRRVAPNPRDNRSGMSRATLLSHEERYGVEEYYLYDPYDFELSGCLREGSTLEVIPEMAGWISPRLGIRFEPRPDGLEVFRPDGHAFSTYLELHKKLEQAEQLAERLKGRLRELGVDPDA